METLEAIAKRTSTRKFKEIQISEENLQAILKAGMSAPVGSGLYESLHITVIQDMNILNIIGDAVTEMIYKKFGKTRFFYVALFCAFIKGVYLKLDALAYCYSIVL